jgi:hypothetical protein
VLSCLCVCVCVCVCVLVTLKQFLTLVVCCADVFLPSPDNLLVNLHECKDMVIELLNQLPNLFEENHETGNALGTALQAAFKLMVSVKLLASSVTFCCCFF